MPNEENRSTNVYDVSTGDRLTSEEAKSRAKNHYEKKDRNIGRRDKKEPNYALRRATAVAITAAMVGGAAIAAHGARENSEQTQQPYSSETGNRAAIEVISHSSAEKMFTGSLVINLSKARVRSTAEVAGKNSPPNIMDNLTHAEQINGVDIPKGTEFIEITWPIEKKDLNGRPQDWIVLAIKYKGDDEIKTGFVADSKSTREEGIVKPRKDGIFSKIEKTTDGQGITQVGQGVIMQKQMGRVTPLNVAP